MKVVMTGFGEVRDIEQERYLNGDGIRELHPKNHRGYIDLSFDGSDPVRVYMPIEQYEAAILPQLPQSPLPSTLR